MMTYFNGSSEPDNKKQVMGEAQSHLQLILEEVDICISNDNEKEQSQIGYKIGMTLPNGQAMYNWELDPKEMMDFRKAGAELYSCRRNEKDGTIAFSAYVVAFSKEEANKLWEDMFVPQLMAALMAGKLDLDKKGK